jgi:PAS domain S-box-containing protein
MSWITNALSDLPVKRKLAITTILTLAAALVFTCAALFTYERITFRDAMTRDLSITAEMISLSSAAGLSFGDADSVDQTLRGLRANPHVVVACVYDASGRVFARYQRVPDASFVWPAVQENANHFGADELDLYQPVTAGGEKIGAVFLRSDLELMWTRLRNYALIAGLVIIAATFAALLIAMRLQRVISDPVSSLAEIAERIAAEKDYSLRATKLGDDELGRLIDRFNEMLTQIQARDAALQAAHHQLEQRVEERTAELASSVSLLNATLDSTNDGILAMDRSGHITGYNSKFGTLWNVSTEVLEQRDRARLLPLLAEQARKPEQFVERIAEIHRQPELTAFDYIELKDGRTIERYANPQWVDGKIAGIVVSCRDVTERKRAEQELARAHRELLDTSRLAGMAEVATGVLHNVGNVLTSVNVSATIISDQVRHSKSAMVRKVSDLFRENAGDLAGFMTSNPKGRQLPEYLDVLAKHIEREQGDVLRELELLRKHIEHIRDIVAMQQNYAKVSGIAETVGVVELVEDALRMNAGALTRHEVELERDYQATPTVTVQKHKVLQVLVNLIRNAKYACDESGRTDKLLRMRITADDDFVQIAVIDNGVGIPAENLTRIFAHGFTTRKDGHGFGLHSGALAAKEIGGTLQVHSDGPGRGATFTLSFPAQMKAAA